MFLPLKSDRIFESQLGVLPMQVSCDDLCGFESSLKGDKEVPRDSCERRILGQSVAKQNALLG